MSIRTARAVLLSWVVVAASLVVVSLGAPHAEAAYPGDDGRIAFVRANQIYTMTAAGRGVTKLTSSGKNYRPKWSPNGRRISYIHEVGGLRDVWVMRADGTGKRAVTRSGDATSAGASWSPNGRRLAFAAAENLYTVRSTAPFGSPTLRSGFSTGGECEGEEESIRVDRFLAWSPDGTRIAVFNHDDCRFDERLDMYYPGTGERRLYDVTGADCCGYREWKDLFWGPGSQFGYTDRDLGEFGEDVDAPSRIVYAGFRSVDGDTGGAPSPSGTFLALTNASSGTAKIIRANADGFGRRVLTRGYQPDWQPRP